MAECPLCRRDDQVQRVSAVVAADTAHAWGHASSGLATARSSGVSQSGLAIALALHRPRMPSGLLKAGVVLLVIGVALGGCFGGMTVLSGAAGGLQPGRLALAFGVGAVWIVLGLVFLVLGVRARRAFRRDAPLRDQAEKVWAALYYCGRDGVVFDPVARQHIAPGATRSYVHDTARGQLAAG